MSQAGELEAAAAGSGEVCLVLGAGNQLAVPFTVRKGGGGGRINGKFNIDGPRCRQPAGGARHGKEEWINGTFQTSREEGCV